MAKWLLDGEQLELRTRAHSRILVWPLTVGLVLVFIASAAYAGLQPGSYATWGIDNQPWRAPLAFLVLGISLVALVSYPVRRVLRWAQTRYLLTDRRILIRRGPWGRIAEAHPLAQLSEIRPTQTWRQRMVGSGNLQLVTVQGLMWTLREVPQIYRFNDETHRLWDMVFRASFQQTPREGDYAGEVGMREKELRKLGRDH